MATKTERIRALNDLLRTIGVGGRIVITSGIAALPPADGETIVRAVQTFTDFNPDNDPHGEHDCAVLTAAGQRVIFKIDLSIGTQKGPPIGVQKGPPFGGPLPGVEGGRWWCSRADGAVGKWPAGATVGESGAGGPLIHSGGVRWSC